MEQIIKEKTLHQKIKNKKKEIKNFLQRIRSERIKVNAINDDSILNTNIKNKAKKTDNKRFYEWAEQQDNIFISEYEMPDCFVPYAWVDKQVLSAANGVQWAREMIFTNRKTYEKMESFEKMRISLNFAEQLSLFDDMK